MSTNQSREVPIEVTSRHQNVSDRTRSYITEKASKLSRFHNRLSRIQVVLDEAHDEFIVELIVHIERGSTMVAKEAAGGYRAAMDALLVKIEKQLKKDSEKRKDHNKSGVNKGVTDADDLAGPDSEETYEDVIRKDLGS